jgi:hypothetical protein
MRASFYLFYILITTCFGLTMAIIRSTYVGWKIYVLVRAGSLFWVEGIRFFYEPRAVAHRIPSTQNSEPALTKTYIFHPTYVDLMMAIVRPKHVVIRMYK